MRRLSISIKMLLLTLSVSIALWWMLDLMQLQELRHEFLADTKRELNNDDRANHQQFNQNVRSLHTASKLISGQEIFANHLKRYANVVFETEAEPKFYHANMPPKWLPKASVLRSFFHARFALLVSQNGTVLEIYHHSPFHGDDEKTLPDELAHPSLLMRRLSHDQAYMTTLGETPFIISAVTIKTGYSSVTLILASPIDDTFLSIGSEKQLHSAIATLVDPHQAKVIASSDRQSIPDGSSLTELEGRFLQTGQSFFDYGASDLGLQFTSFYPTEEAELLSNQILGMDSRQRIILVGLLITAFLILSLWLSRRIGRLVVRVRNFSEEILGVSLVRATSGDELEELDKNFKMLASEVENSRNQLQQELVEKDALNIVMHQEQELVENIVLRMRKDARFYSEKVSCLISPLERTNGDILVSSKTPSSKQHILLGDFTGHGLPAAIGGPLVTSVFYVMSESGFSLSTITEQINRELCSKLPVNIFLAATMIERDMKSGEVRLWNCGMQDLLHIRDGMIVARYPSTDLSLGIREQSDIDQFAMHLTLTQGDYLVAYTDGVIEAESEQGERFGQERFEKLLVHNFQNEIPLENLVGSVKEFSGDVGVSDDVTLIALHG